MHVRKSTAILIVAAIVALAWWGVTIAVGAPPDPSGSSSAEPGSGQGVTAAAATAPDGPGFLMLPAPGFIPLNSDTDYYNGGNYLETKAGSANVSYSAPVHLPQGARVTKITLNCYDADASTRVITRLFRAGATGYWDALTDFFNSGTAFDGGYFSGSVDAITEDDVNLIDNSTYGYFLNAWVHIGDVKLYQVRVDYTFKNYLPAVLKNYTH